MSTLFHLQTDGATERTNMSIGQMFWALIKPDQKNWVEKSPLIEFMIKSIVPLEPRWWYPSITAMNTTAVETATTIDNADVPMEGPQAGPSTTNNGTMLGTPPDNVPME